MKIILKNGIQITISGNDAMEKAISEQIRQGQAIDEKSFNFIDGETNKTALFIKWSEVALIFHSVNVM